MANTVVVHYPAPGVRPVPAELSGEKSGGFYMAAQRVKDGYPPASASLLRMCAEALLEEIAASNMSTEDFETWLYDEKKRKLKVHERIGTLAKHGHIGPRSKAAFDLLKHFGNDAVHGLNEIDTKDEAADVEQLIQLVDLVIEDSIRVPQMLKSLAAKVPEHKIAGDAGRDRGIEKKYDKTKGQ